MQHRDSRRMGRINMNSKECPICGEHTSDGFCEWCESEI